MQQFRQEKRTTSSQPPNSITISKRIFPFLFGVIHFLSPVFLCFCLKPRALVRSLECNAKIRSKRIRSNNHTYEQTAKTENTRPMSIDDFDAGLSQPTISNIPFMTEKNRIVKKVVALLFYHWSAVSLFEGRSSREEGNASVGNLFKDRLRFES